MQPRWHAATIVACRAGLQVWFRQGQQAVSASLCLGYFAPVRHYNLPHLTASQAAPSHAINHNCLNLTLSACPENRRQWQTGPDIAWVGRIPTGVGPEHHRLKRRWAFGWLTGTSVTWWARRWDVQSDVGEVIS